MNSYSRGSSHMIKQNKLTVVGIQNVVVSRFRVRSTTSKKWFLKKIQVTIHETRSIWCRVGIHVDFTSILHSLTPLVPQAQCEADLDPRMRVLEMKWSRALSLSLVCEGALTIIIHSLWFFIIIINIQALVLKQSAIYSLTIVRAPSAPWNHPSHWLRSHQLHADRLPVVRSSSGSTNGSDRSSGLTLKGSQTR